MIDARPNTPFWILYPKRNPSPSGGVGPCNWAVEAAAHCRADSDLVPAM